MDKFIARPSWSPNGDSLMVLGRRPDGQDSNVYELVMIDVKAGSEKRTIPLKGIWPRDSAWLDEGHALVSGIAASASDMERIYRVDLASGELTPVTDPPASYMGLNLARDGVVTTLFDMRTSIWANDEKVVAERHDDAGSVAPDCVGGLVFQAATPEGTRVFAAGSKQPDPRLVADNAAAPIVTCDGKTVVFQRGGARPGLYRVNIDRTGEAILVKGNAYSAHMLPDSKTVVYVADVGNDLQVVRSVPLYAENPSFRGLLPPQHIRRVAVSSDNRLKVETLSADGRSSVSVCDLPDCANPTASPWPSGRWTRDFRGLADDVFDRKNILVRPFDGTAAHSITDFKDMTIQDFAWSPDGKRLAVTRRSILGNTVLIKGIR